jgi:hypothetical protein
MAKQQSFPCALPPHPPVCLFIRWPQGWSQGGLVTSWFLQAGSWTLVLHGLRVHPRSTPGMSLLV